MIEKKCKVKCEDFFTDRERYSAPKKLKCLVTL